MPKNFQYIELTLPSTFSEDEETTFDAVEKMEHCSHTSKVGRDQLVNLLRGVREDVKAAYGSNLRGHDINDEEMDWPDLSLRYKEICKLLDALDAEEQARLAKVE